MVVLAGCIGRQYFSSLSLQRRQYSEATGSLHRSKSSGGKVKYGAVDIGNSPHAANRLYNQAKSMRSSENMDARGPALRPIATTPDL